MKAPATPILLALALLGCTPSSTVTPTNLITNPGKFASPGGSRELVISAGAGSLIQYKIIHRPTQNEFVPDRAFSDAMRWAFCWEGDDTLWVHSSDIGTSVWKIGSDGAFSQHWIEADTSVGHSVPRVLYDYLPASLRSRLGNTDDDNTEPVAPPNGGPVGRE